jgi:hypothetical protein
MLAKPCRKLWVSAEPVQAALAAQCPAEESGDLRRGRPDAAELLAYQLRHGGER